jgi:hypothetical protein
MDMCTVKPILGLSLVKLEATATTRGSASYWEAWEWSNLPGSWDALVALKSLGKVGHLSNIVHLSFYTYPSSQVLP